MESFINVIRKYCTMDKERKNVQLVPVRNAHLIKLQNTISITNRLVSNSDKLIYQLFNTFKNV